MTTRFSPVYEVWSINDLAELQKLMIATFACDNPRFFYSGKNYKISYPNIPLAISPITQDSNRMNKLLVQVFKRKTNIVNSPIWYFRKRSTTFQQKAQLLGSRLQWRNLSQKGLDYQVLEWQLFIDSSMTILKANLLFNGLMESKHTTIRSGELCCKNETKLGEHTYISSWYEIIR